MVTNQAQHARTARPSALVEFARHHAHITLRTASRQVMRHGYELKRRRVSQHNFIFITRGRVVWVIDDEPVDLRAGDLLIVPPGVPHHGYSHTQRVTLLSLHVAATLPGGQDAFELLPPPRRQRVARDSHLDRYLRSALAEFDRPESEEARLMLMSWARLVTLEMLRDNDLRGLIEPRPLEPIILAVMEQLNHRFAEPTDLPALARWAGYSPQHLNRLFRRQIGMTPLQYLTRLRMQHAAALLGDDRLTVAAIARRVGYQDPFYFSRLFKQHMGQSPAQHREAVAGEADARGVGSNSPWPDSSAPFPTPPEAPSMGDNAGGRARERRDATRHRPT